MTTSENPYATPATEADAEAVLAAQPEHGEARIFSASGRIGRVRYLAWMMGLNLVFFAALAVVTGLFGVLAATGGSVEGGWDDPAGAAGQIMSAGLGVVSLVLYVAVLVLSFMFVVQRSHDFNMNGWFSLVILVPLVNLVFFLIPGTAGPNRFGPPPPPNSTGVLILAWLVPVAVILGILAAIAIPAYQQYLTRM
jgi:uncharacterized membrane protein YhaH (DUF805 family)